MPERIYVQAKIPENKSEFQNPTLRNIQPFHLYIVYEDSQGNESVIRGGPTTGVKLLDSFGDIAVSAGTPYKKSIDYIEPEKRFTRPTKILDLQGRNAEDVWKVMVQQAQQIGDKKIDYDIDVIDVSENSNSVIASVLNSAGFVPEENLPPTISAVNAVGFKNLFGKDDLDILLEGDLNNDHSDVIYGGFGDDAIFGNAGNDTLKGSVSYDYDNDNEYEIDILTGGTGEDTFVLGDNGKLFYTKGEDYTYDLIPGEGRIPDGPGPDPGLFITPKDFAVLNDFNPQDGDKIQIPEGTDIFVRTIKNDGLIEGLAEHPKYNDSPFNPDAYSATILDASNSELIAVVPYNGLDPLIPPISFEIDTVEFV